MDDDTEADDVVVAMMCWEFVQVLQDLQSVRDDDLMTRSIKSLCDNSTFEMVRQTGRTKTLCHAASLDLCANMLCTRRRGGVSLVSADGGILEGGDACGNTSELCC